MGTVIKQMEGVVATKGAGCRSDFKNYNIHYIQRWRLKNYPLIWSVGEHHASILDIDTYAKSFALDESQRLGYVAEGMPFQYYTEYHKNDDFYLIYEDRIIKITTEEARWAIRHATLTAVSKWESENGPLPKKCKVKVRFPNVKLRDLKNMLYQDANEDSGTLFKCLKRLQKRSQRYLDHHINVYIRPGETEFGFRERYNNEDGLVGGIVYHGNPNKGYMQNNSFQLSPMYGWEIHT